MSKAVSAAGADRVSITVAVRDAEGYVAEALDSVLAQLEPGDELVVVDDGSTDGTAEVLASYRDRALVISQPPLGVSRARNLGVARSGNDLIGFLDADDRWAPGSLGHRRGVLAHEPDVDVVIGATTEFLDDGIEDPRTVGLRPPMARATGFSLGALLARRWVFDEVPFEAGQLLAEYAEWLSRARAAGVRFREVPQVVLERRIRPGSLTTDGRAYREALLGALRADIQRRRHP